MRTFTMSLLVTAVVAVVSLAAPAAAEAKQHRFVGEHPVPAGGFCHINAPHVHVYAPARAEVLYRNHDGWSYFVGDPVAYGYAGPKHAYSGAHPVHVDVAIGEVEVDGDEVEYCYIKGPHYHLVAPPPETHFELKGEVYWYTGDFPPEFAAARPKLARINVVLEPIAYARPVVLVEPPPRWHDVLVVEAAVPVVEAEVHAPAVVVEPPRAQIGFGFHVAVPAPVVDVHVGGPAVVVHDHRPDVVVVPARPGRVKFHGEGRFEGRVKVKAKGHGKGRF